MKLLLYILAGCLVHLFVIPSNAQSPTADFSHHFKLLPQPQKTEVRKGTGLTAGQLRHLLLSGDSKKPVLFGELLLLSSAAKGERDTYPSDQYGCASSAISGRLPA